MRERYPLGRRPGHEAKDEYQKHAGGARQHKHGPAGARRRQHHGAGGILFKEQRSDSASSDSGWVRKGEQTSEHPSGPGAQHVLKGLGTRQPSARGQGAQEPSPPWGEIALGGARQPSGRLDGQPKDPPSSSIKLLRRCSGRRITAPAFPERRHQRQGWWMAREPPRTAHPRPENFIRDSCNEPAMVQPCPVMREQPVPPACLFAGRPTTLQAHRPPYPQIGRA